MTHLARELLLVYRLLRVSNNDENNGKVFVCYISNAHNQP